MYQWDVFVYGGDGADFDVFGLIEFNDDDIEYWGVIEFDCL